MSALWHHKSLNRLETEKLLLESEKDGSFLVRDSESVANAFVLSILFQGHIHHYRIFTEKGGRYYMQAVPGVENQHFELLEQIVTYYSQPDRGLPCQLRYPVINDSIEEEDSDDEDEDEDNSKDVVLDNDAMAALAMKNQITSFSQVKSEGVDKDFLEALGAYSGDPLLADLRTASNGGQTLEGLQKLLSSSSINLMKELTILITRLSFLQSIYNSKSPDQTRTLKFTSLIKTEENPSDYELLCRLLGDGIAGVSTLHTQALKTLTDLAKISEGVDGQQEPTKPQRRDFEVIEKTVSLRGKLYLTVDYIKGNISFLKSQGELPDTSNTIHHNKILQLIKSRKNIKRLGIKIDSKPVKEYDFDDGKSREVFCQLVQQVKNQDPKMSTLDQISVFVGTWNMGDSNPPPGLSPWFKCQGHGITCDTDVAHFAHDIYAIGTQECSISEGSWIPKIKSELLKLFGIEFKTVAMSSLWGIRLVILVKNDHQNLISHVKQSCVKTGIANALGNKGAVGISFMFSATSLCFINCHLAARSTRVLRRNQNYHDILKGLNLGQKNVFDLTNQFNHVFWFGDLNYRIDMEVTDVLDDIKSKNFYKMREADQLQKEIKKGKVFVGFKESLITFPPTYRRKRGLNNYVWEKVKRSGILVNVPSWCDRVLCHSFPETKMLNTSYGCTDSIRTSDHWPVFSTFDVGITSQYAACPVSPDKNGKPSSKEDCKIIFNKIEAKINTNSKPQFIIEFHSSCLEKVEKSKQNSIKNTLPKKAGSSHGKILQASPAWGFQVLPTLYPIIPDRTYLKDQHLLLAIKSVDSDESYGECCISLKAMIGHNPQEFSAILTHSGEETGSISGEMHVKLLHSEDEAFSTSKGLIQENDEDDDVNMNKLGGKPSKNTKRRSSDKAVKTESADSAIGSSKRHTVHSMKDRNPAPLPKARPRSHPDRPLSEPLCVPPPLPAKQFVPQTVMELLTRIGFSQYYEVMVQNGFDDVVFLESLSENDLDGTDVPEHIRKPLVSSIQAVMKPKKLSLHREISTHCPHTEHKY